MFKKSSVKIMKKRIITGVMAGLFAIGLLVLVGFGYTKYLSIFAAVFSAIGAYEVLRVSKCKNKVLIGMVCAVAAFVPFYIAFNLASVIPVSTGVLIAVYVISALLVMLKFYDITRFEHVALGLFGSIAIPSSIMTLYKVDVLCSSHPELFQRSQIVFMLLCTMFAAWLCDTFAYFFGRKLGKHKLSPKISPKKSVEGAIGGAAGATVCSVIAYIVCEICYFTNGTIKVWMVVPAVLLLCVIGMCGDLSASVIKRNFGEKDFGNLFPGHGGVLDRIDSFLFTMPTLYILLSIVVAIV